MNTSQSFTSGLKNDSREQPFKFPVFNDEHSFVSELTQEIEEEEERESEGSEGSEESEEVVQYDPLTFSKQQEEAGQQVVSYYMDTNDLCKWVVLFAQMQSGKTETFRFIAAEMLRLNLVERVVIFSGNAETELKDQLTNTDKKEKFFSKYDLYLEETLGITSSRERIPIKNKISDSRNTVIVWGTELKKYHGPTEKTLFIWEESHHAQNLNQCPDAFLKHVGISADGHEDILSSKGNYVLSVSATPFSEFSDNHHENQNKKFYRMPPGNSYNSVGKMHTSGRILAYKDLNSGLNTAFSMRSDSPKWALVRASSAKAEEAVCATAQQYDYDVIFYDSIHDCVVDGVVLKQKKKGENDEKDTKNLEFLKNAPRKNTVVILKEMCRMGKELHKEHVLFCFETAKNSKTDTILQGLLGRCCGYFHSESIVVYIPEKFMNSGELQRYIAFADGRVMSCKNGRNLRTTFTYCNAYPIIQVRVKKEHITTYDRDLIFTDIQNAFEHGYCDEENFNSPEVFAQIKAKVKSACEKKKADRYNLSPNNKSYGPEKGNTAEKIITAIKDKKPVFIKSSNGCKNQDKDMEISFWIIKAGNKGLRCGDVYVDCSVSDYSQQETIPETTKREVFAHRLENGETHVSNGTFALYLRPDTANSVAEMTEDLLDFVEISLRKNSSRGVHSNQDAETKDFKGVCVSNTVLEGLQKNGEIYNQVLQTHGVQLKISKASGITSKALKIAGLVRLTAITW